MLMFCGVMIGVVESVVKLARLDWSVAVWLNANGKAKSENTNAVAMAYLFFAEGIEGNDLWSFNWLLI